MGKIPSLYSIVEALGLGKILRGAWRQDSKDMKHDLYFLLVKSLFAPIFTSTLLWETVGIYPSGTILQHLSFYLNDFDLDFPYGLS